MAVAGVAIGLNTMSPLQPTFSDMTPEERAKYCRGLVIAVASMVPLLLFVYFVIP